VPGPRTSPGPPAADPTHATNDTGVIRVSRGPPTVPTVTSTSRLDPDRPAAPRLRRTPTADVAVFRTPVRGHAFAARPPGGHDPGPGRPARLVREPDNPRDPLAVAVWADGGIPWRVGYLDRVVAARLAPRLDAGQRFVVELDGWVDAPGSAWRRPLLRVTALATPSRPEAPPPDGLAGRPPGVRRRVLAPRR
jgi:hypothetical protein